MAGGRLITVSELRCACVDREWRERWRRGESPPTIAFTKGGAVPVQGALFHQLAFDFTEWLIARPAHELTALESAESLWVAMYDRFAHPRLDDLAAKAQVPSAHHLSRALRCFCTQLVDLRTRAGVAFQTWHDIYLTREFTITRVPFCAGRISVSGRPDAVRVHPEHGVEVIDYKLSRGSSVKQDLVQLAIYARLLREVKPGLRFSGALEYYEPDLHVMAATTAELDALFDEIVAPVLAELCADPGAVPLVVESDTPAVANPFEELAARIERCFGAFKLGVTVLRSEEAPQLSRYRVLPADGVKVASLANRAEDLQVALGLVHPPLIRAAPGCVTIDLPKEKPDVVHWRDVMPSNDVNAPALAFPVGIGVEGKMIIADLGDPNTCHALVAGASGSGKSEFLKAVAATLIFRNPAARLRLTLIDPKSVTFAAMRGSLHLEGPILTDVGAVLPVLESVVADMESRYRILAERGCDHLAQLADDVGLPYRVIIFDEFADLVMQGKKEREAFETLVSRIAQKGRAAGIHLILATQRPDSKVVTGLIKSNLPLRVCLRVTSAINSQIVLDEPGAEALLGKGDLLCHRGLGLERAQAPFITREELAKLVNPGGANTPVGAPR